MFIQLGESAARHVVIPVFTKESQNEHFINEHFNR